ncbi:MAG: hypothetical protein Q9202_002003 [Teloschistes flavicans]
MPTFSELARLPPYQRMEAYLAIYNSPDYPWNYIIDPLRPKSSTEIRIIPDLERLVEEAKAAGLSQQAIDTQKLGTVKVRFSEANTHSIEHILTCVVLVQVIRLAIFSYSLHQATRTLRKYIPLYDQEDAEERRRCTRDLRSMADILGFIKDALRKPVDEKALEAASLEQWRDWKDNMLHLHRLMHPLGKELRIVWKAVKSHCPAPDR